MAYHYPETAWLFKEAEEKKRYFEDQWKYENPHCPPPIRCLDINVLEPFLRTPTAVECLYNLASRLGIPPSHQLFLEAEWIIDHVLQRNVMRHRPEGQRPSHVAAVALYVASHFIPRLVTADMGECIRPYSAVDIGQAAGIEYYEVWKDYNALSSYQGGMGTFIRSGLMADPAMQAILKGLQKVASPTTCA